MRQLTIAAAGAAMVLAGFPAMAQEGGAAQPSETTETFGNWTVCCQKPSAEAPHTCEVLHTIHGQGGTIAQIAIGMPRGCIVPFRFAREVATRFRTDPGFTLRVFDLDGSRIDVPVSLMGFSVAFAALRQS